MFAAPLSVHAQSEWRRVLVIAAHPDDEDTQLISWLQLGGKAETAYLSLTRGDGFAAKMLKDQVLYEQLTKTITDLNAILADVRKNPRKYTKGMISVFD